MFMEHVHFNFEDELNPVCQNTVMQKYIIHLFKASFTLAFSILNVWNFKGFESFINAVFQYFVILQSCKTRSGFDSCLRHAVADSVISDHAYDNKNIVIVLRLAINDRRLDSQIN